MIDEDKPEERGARNSIRERLKSPFGRKREKISDTANVDTAKTQEETDSSTSRFSEVISRYRPVIERVVLDGLVGIAEDKLQDDVLIASIFNKAYELLPTPVRLVLPREKCLNWLMQNREPLLLKLGDYRSTSSESGQQITLPPPTEK
ncbi:hypothetical protein ACRW16_15710 [Escherichia coli]|uniref:hypothetical protein n=1 Tax=Escherichia coli TaxID=562 RepID=UPI000DE11D79|nr:hypothetical protein [Escherichia coli]EEW7592485.1 hypothetical protein [Escherichia coli]EJC8044178.1 hypothetical protein [Escherichia coli]RBJ23556.1 hypothetical protein DSB62_21710 [Escherichia coli]